MIILQQYPNIGIIKEDIRNEKKRSNREFLGISAAEATIELLKLGPYLYKYAVNEENQLDSIIVIPRALLAFFRKSSNVIFLDSTFNKNKYNRPLLNIVGLTGNNQTIPLGFAILSGQCEKSFTWALEAIKSSLETENISLPSVFLVDREQACINAIEATFPNTNIILCQWHIKKDVEAYIRNKHGQVTK